MRSRGVGRFPSILDGGTPRPYWWVSRSPRSSPTSTSPVSSPTTAGQFGARIVTTTTKCTPGHKFGVDRLSRTESVAEGREEGRVPTPTQDPPEWRSLDYKSESPFSHTGSLTKGQGSRNLSSSPEFDDPVGPGSVDGGGFLVSLRSPPDLLSVMSLPLFSRLRTGRGLALPTTM